MDGFTERVYHFIREHQLIEAGDHVIVGLSGGADSVCLLWMLSQLRDLLQIKLTAIHVHHGLRGQEADQDQQYSEMLCRRLDVDCISFKADIRQMADERHLSLEEAGRYYRYQCFEEIRQKLGADRIAVAHHMDDQAETVLMNLFRGSGTDGLAGIPLCRGYIIRPLLGMRSQEIRDYLRETGLEYCNDASNQETVYTRNKIRLELLPMISEEINAGAVRHIAEMAQQAAQVRAYIRRQGQEAFAGCVHSLNYEAGGIKGYCIEAESYMKLDPVLRREVIRQSLAGLADGLKDIGSVHIRDVDQLFGRQSGKRVDLPYKLLAVRTFDAVEIRRKDDEDELVISEDMIRLSVFEAPDQADKKMRFPQNTYTKWFDYGKIQNGTTVRCRENGDYMTLRDGKRKKLKRILIDDKVAADVRDHLPLLADGQHIMWVPATGRISEYYKVSPETEQILQAVYLAEENADTASR